MVQSINWEQAGKYAAVASAIFSAIAAFYSRRLVVALVRAQKVSVRPLAQFFLDDRENRIAVILENRGTGPMLVDEFSVIRDGKTVVKNSVVYDEDLPWNETYVVDFAARLGGEVLRPGQKVWLLLVRGAASDEAFASYRTSLREYLSKLTFQVKYKDIYEAVYGPHVLNGEWFGRHNESRPGST